MFIGLPVRVIKSLKGSKRVKQVAAQLLQAGNYIGRAKEGFNIYDRAQVANLIAAFTLYEKLWKDLESSAGWYTQITYPFSLEFPKKMRELLGLHNKMKENLLKAYGALLEEELIKEKV